MSIFPRPLKKVREKIVPFCEDDLIPSNNLGAGVADENTILYGDGVWRTYLSKFVFVNDLSNLPDPIAGVITLLDGYTYYFNGTIDLLGSRLVSGVDTTILGSSSEVCRIKSTGLVGTALLSSNYSLPIRNITIEADIAVNLIGDGVATALDWEGLNFTNCNSVGLIKDYNNFVMTNSAFLNSGNLTFDGVFGTVAFSQCFFDLRAGTTQITVASTASFSRRFRIIYSSLVAMVGETAINFSTSATVNPEGYILDVVNFSGGGTYIVGVQHSDNKAAFNRCVGIQNSASFGHYYMLGNTTQTIISSTSVAYKVLGTTTNDPLTQRFAHSNNRLTYIGAITRTFKVNVYVTLTSNNNQLLSIYVAKNGTIVSTSESRVTMSGNGDREAIPCQAAVSLSTNDYIEVFVRNNTSVFNITATYLSVIVDRTP